VITDFFTSGFFTQRYTAAVDAGGADASTWAVQVSSLSGRIRALSGRERTGNERREVDATHRFYCSYLTTINERDRIGKTYGTAANISGASGTSTITVTTSAAHGFLVNDRVRISSVAGMTNINNVYTILTVPLTTTFTISQSTSQTYTSGGSVSKCYLWDIVFVDDPHLQNEFMQMDCVPVQI
jgi:head-tail adaptor